MNTIHIPKWLAVLLIGSSSVLSSCIMDSGSGNSSSNDTTKTTVLPKQGTLYSGQGEPTSAYAQEGDFYIDTLTNTLYGPKKNGVWRAGLNLAGKNGVDGLNGVNGLNGINGANGNTILHGAGIPAASLGMNGDFYIDTSNMMLFGPKADGAWPTLGVALKGTNGANGYSVLNGTGAPANTLGVDGDFYIDTNQTLLYGPKTNGAWLSAGVKLRGDKGLAALLATEAEAAGTQCASGGIKITAGVDTNDNSVLDANEVNASSTRYVCNGTSGTNGVNGANGLNGANGTNGLNGIDGYSTLIQTSSEASGIHCAAGGAKIEAGIDANKNNLLESNEIVTSATRYICNGLSGTNGIDGLNGKGVLNGAGLPDNALGQDGDFYIDTTTSTLIGPKKNNVWPTTGVAMAGTNGSNGNTILNGTGTPLNSLGADGDFYIDTTTTTLFGPKKNGTWPTTGVDLKGQNGVNGTNGANGTNGTDGVDGNSVLNGTGAPLALVGKNGDFYIDTTTTTLYGPKTAGVWPLTGIALKGNNGTNGLNGVDGKDGVNGTNGINGTNGTNGNTLLNGSGIPLANIGVNGDFYIDTTTTTLYGPKADGLWPNVGIGLKGTNGTNGINGTNGTSSLVKTTAEAAGANCSAGGTRLDQGLDDGLPTGTANNGTLESGEVESTRYVCNGVNGTNGANGADGVNGANGNDGLNGQDGKDGLNGTNGVNGTNGTNGNTVLNGTTDPSNTLGVDGDFYINTTTSTMFGPKAGGVWPSTGVLLKGTNGTNGTNGLNGSNGTNGTNGTNGFNSLIKTTAETAGANCSNGGTRIEVGIDDGLPSGVANNTTLDAGEVESTRYVCNGVNGTNGTNGSNGLNGTNGTNGTNGINGSNGLNSLIKTTTEAAGANCSAGGIKVEAGLDDGAPSGTASNGVLEAGEVTSTQYVCNGTNGSGSSTATGLGNLKDANNQVLGTVMQVGAGNMTVKTSTGYYFIMNWDATFPDQQIYYSGSGCTGSMWLNAGTTNTSKRYAKFLVYEGKTGNFYVPSGEDANGYATNTAFTATALWNSSAGVWQCVGGGSNGGWVLAAISRTTAGLPNTITPPLSIQ